MLRHENRLLSTVSQSTRKAKEKYSFRKESNKFAKHLLFTPKEIRIKIEQLRQ